MLAGATHHLWYDCPETFVDVMTKDLLGVSEHIFQIKKYTTNYVDKEGNLTHTDTEFLERSLQFDETVTVISIDKDGNSYIMGEN